MANDSKRTSQLGITTTLQANDRVVVLTNPANTIIANTQTILMSNFIAAVASNMPGPFANDSVANTNGVAVRAIYFDTNGIVRLRMV